MKLSTFLLFSILSIFKAQNINTADSSNEETNLEYKFLESPVFWVNVGLVIWGLLSLMAIFSRFGNFCLLTYLKYRGKPLNTILFYVVAFLVNYLVSSHTHSFLDGASSSEYKIISVFKYIKSQKTI